MPQGYPMEPQQFAPPPVYNWDAPPQYQPPEGGTKVLANQNIRPMPEQMGPGESSRVQQPESTYRSMA